MKKVFLKSISLEHWRGYSRQVVFSQKTKIAADNGLGKSSLLNAFLWLLTGYDDEDRQNYQLFDNTVPQTHENAVPASVEAILEVDGYEYTFKKTAKQGWSRPRGKSEYERKGTDDYTFCTDGIEVSATQYKAQVESLLAPIDKLKIMLNLRYFLMLDWKEMRKQLASMVGEIKPEDFEDDYGDILQDLVKYSPDELKSLYKAKIKPIKDSIEGLPKAIETMQANLPDLTEAEEARKSIDETKRQIADIDDKIVGAGDFVKPYINRRNAELAEISNLQEDFNKAQTVYMGNFNLEEEKIQKKIRDVESYNIEVYNDNCKAEAKRKADERELMKLNDLLATLQKRHEELTEQNRECKTRVFTGEKCAYCGQELPENKLEEARKRFNEQKEKDHAYIVAQGKANKEQIENTLRRIAELKDELAKPLETKAYQDKSSLEQELASLRASFVPYDKTAEGAAKVSVIEEKRANLTAIPQQDNNVLLEMKRGLLDEIERNSKKLGLKDEYDKQIEKIKDLQEELRNNSIERAKLEGKLAKVKEYEEEKARIISDRVNGKFNYVQIEMSETNKSGDIVPACVIRDAKGVNAHVTNNASRILCGLDIALAFCKEYDISMPIFIDNAESVNTFNMPDFDNQAVFLNFEATPFHVEHLTK